MCEPTEADYQAEAARYAEEQSQPKRRTFRSPLEAQTPAEQAREEAQNRQVMAQVEAEL